MEDVNVKRGNFFRNHRDWSFKFFVELVDSLQQVLGLFTLVIYPIETTSGMDFEM
jgi:hypothetical protein